MLTDMMGFITKFLKEFSLSSFLFGLIPLVVYWSNSFIQFKRNNIQELKALAKDLIDVWAGMRKSALKIATCTHWIKLYENDDSDFYKAKILEWSKEVYVEKNSLATLYNRSLCLIGYLYFYYNGYTIQNSLDTLFGEIKNTEWDQQTYTKSCRELQKFQEQGVLILKEIKKEIDALSTLCPRPIHFVKTTWHAFDLESNSLQRKMKFVFKKRYRKFLRNR